MMIKPVWLRKMFILFLLLVYFNISLFFYVNSLSSKRYCEFTQINSDLDFKSSNNDVLILQNFLFHYYGVAEEVNPTGFFGLQTREYLLLFQKEHNIQPVTGNFGPLTRSKIKELCQESFNKLDVDSKSSETKNGTFSTQEQMIKKKGNTPPFHSFCITPWGNKKVLDGSFIKRDPYFTNGVYTRTIVDLYAKCVNGIWYICDQKKQNCKRL